MHIDDQILLSAIDFQMATRRDVHFFYTNNFQPRRWKSILKHVSFAKPECNNCYLYLIINYFWHWKKDVTYMLSWPTSFFHEDANPQKSTKRLIHKFYLFLLKIAIIRTELKILFWLAKYFVYTIFHRKIKICQKISNNL